MQVCTTKAEIRAAVRNFRKTGGPVGLVPTMGYLHEGHLSLVRAARRDSRWTVVTIFVNPTQFGDPADLENYPRDTERDLDMLRAAGVDAVFIPPVEEIYAADAETIVETTRIANMLHGLVRPGHFRGVTTVVAKLFNIVGPDAAWFGEKDYQQLQAIRRMVQDLHMPLTVRGVATVREADGLAMSSRNVRLTPGDRAAAPVLHRALELAAEAAEHGADVVEIEELIARTIAAEPRAVLRGLDIVAAETLAPLEGRLKTPAAIMVSAEFGGVLLIDQRVTTPGAQT